MAALLNAAEALTAEEQRALILALTDSYAGRSDAPPSPSIKRRRRRAAAVECLTRATEHEGSIPTKRRYDAIRAELGLELSGRQIIDTFNKWSYAKQVVAGERSAMARPTVQSRPLRQRVPADLLDHVRLFLDSKPAKTTKTEYDEWVVARNVGAPSETVLPDARAIRFALHLDWNGVLAVARGAASLDEAVENFHKALLLEELLGRTDAAYLLKTTSPKIVNAQRRGDFPPVAAMIAKAPVWTREDIMAVRDDVAPPNAGKPDGFLSSEVVDSREAAELYGLHSKTFVSTAWTRGVTPGGSVSGAAWFRRSELVVLSR